MGMPIESKKQSQAKADWMKDNSKVYGVRVMKRTEPELYEFLQKQEVPTATIKAALKEYMAHHPQE